MFVSEKDQKAVFQCQNRHLAKNWFQGPVKPMQRGQFCFAIMGRKNVFLPHAADSQFGHP